MDLAWVDLLICLILFALLLLRMYGVLRSYGVTIRSRGIVGLVTCRCSCRY